MSPQPKSLDDPLFGRLEPEYPGWRGRMRFPTLAACRSRWELSRDERMVRSAVVPDKGDGHVTVAVHDETGEGPSDPQRAAYRSIMDNQERVAANILSGLVRGTKYFSSFAGGPFQADAERLGLVSVDGIRELVELSSIHFLEQARDGECYVTAEFGCCWDEEHGISVLIHRGQFVASSCGSDFCGRGSVDSLEAHARYCREHLDRAAEGATRHFELIAGSTRKFWEISVSGSAVRTRWGRIGAPGQNKTKTFKDAAAAKQAYDKLVAEKTGKGYREK